MKKYIAILTQHLRAFLSWWFAELFSLVPPALLALARRRRVRVMVEVDRGELVVTSMKDGRSTGAPADGPVIRGTPCHVRIPSSAVMRKSLTLPLAAAEMMRDVLGLQVEQETPFRSDEVRFDYVVVSRDGLAKQVVVEWTLAPREIIERACRVAESAGFAVASAGPVEDGGIVGRVDFLRHGAPTAAAGRWRGLRPALAACLVALILAAVAVPLARKHQALAEQREQLAQSRTAAQAVLRLREEVAGLRDRRDFILARRLERPTVSLLLREVTELLPDDVWLQRLALSRSEVSISGSSPASSRLVQDIEAHPRFEQVVFRAPTMRQADSGLDEFNLSFRVTSGASAR